MDNELKNLDNIKYRLENKGFDIEFIKSAVTRLSLCSNTPKVNK